MNSTTTTIAASASSKPQTPPPPPLPITALPEKDLERGSKPPSPTRSTHTNPSPHSAHRPPSPPPEIPWGPSHPCYPHLNPHVPLTSPLYTTTRIIRIRRDWMIAGDLAPTFSNIYPEILLPWISEADFRNLIKTVNKKLIATYSPYAWRNWFDAVMGVATGWLWEDVGAAGVKRGVRDVEGWVEEWNRGREEGVRVVPLRRTAYLTMDIQIPDPRVGVAGSEAGTKEGSAADGEGNGEEEGRK